MTARIPKPLDAAMNALCQAKGFVKERAVAAAVQLFIRAEPAAQAEYYMAAYEQAGAMPADAPASTLGADAEQALASGKKRRARRGA